MWSRAQRTRWGNQRLCIAGPRTRSNLTCDYIKTTDQTGVSPLVLRIFSTCNRGSCSHLYRRRCARCRYRSEPATASMASTRIAFVCADSRTTVRAWYRWLRDLAMAIPTSGRTRTTAGLPAISFCINWALHLGNCTRCEQSMGNLDRDMTSLGELSTQFQWDKYK